MLALLVVLVPTLTVFEIHFIRLSEDHRKEIEIWLQNKYRDYDNEYRGFTQWYHDYPTPDACFRDANGTAVDGAKGPVAQQRSKVCQLHVLSDCLWVSARYDLV